MTSRKRIQSKDSTTFFYILAFITLAMFTYGVEKDMEFKQAEMYVDYN